MQTTIHTETNQYPIKILITRITFLLFILLGFLISLKLMSFGFEAFGDQAAKNLIYTYATSPVISLFIGLLATAITQSSSLTTSIVVSLVASGQFNSIADAVPLIIGANIGTSITSTIVSMGHMGNRKEFNKAISAATVHDFFNLIAHGGAGYSLVKSSIGGGNDNLVNVIGGISPRFRISDGLFFAIDTSVIFNISQHYNFDGTLAYTDAVNSFTGITYNVTAGIIYKFNEL